MVDFEHVIATKIPADAYMFNFTNEYNKLMY